MTRKRSIASVLDDDPNRPRAVPSTRRIRSTSGILSEELTLNQPATSTHNRNRLVECNCSRCNGQLVDPRTKTIHEITRQSNQDSNDNPEDFPLPTIYLSNEPPTEFRQELNEDYEHGEASTTILSGSQSQENIQQISAESDSDSEFTFLSRKRSRRYTIRQVPANLDNIFEQMNLAEHLTEEDEGATDTDTTTGEPDDPDDENLDNFEDYSSPDYEPLRDPPASESTSGRFLWILLWIMNFRTRFNLPETGTESLIKFIKLLLAEISSSEFDEFPDSLYMARKELGMQDNFYTFAACPKCHKLYKKQEVEEFQEGETRTIMKCRHVEFPNSTTRRLRQCQASLSEKISVANRRFSLKSILIFPFAGICQQLEKMYNRPDFENNLRHWTNRTYFDNILTDIYDGQIWKNFEDSANSTKFFRSEVADSHLGLVLNLDWFQPYDGTIHSTGVIYAIICNLPRNIQF
jgi:hypothetical protein